MPHTHWYKLEWPLFSSTSQSHVCTNVGWNIGINVVSSLKLTPPPTYAHTIEAAAALILVVFALSPISQLSISFPFHNKAHILLSITTTTTSTITWTLWHSCSALAFLLCFAISSTQVVKLSQLLFFFILFTYFLTLPLWTVQISQDFFPYPFHIRIQLSYLSCPTAHFQAILSTLKLLIILQ